MSPEQASGRAVGAPSDIYSLGLVLYELIAKTKPFAGDGAAALAQRPEDRFQTAGELREALEDWLHPDAHKTAVKDKRRFMVAAILATTMLVGTGVYVAIERGAIHRKTRRSSGNVPR